MAFSALELELVDQVVGRLCRRPVPARAPVGARLGYEVTGHRVIVVATIPDARDASAPALRRPVAKLSFVRKAATWRLYWPRTAHRWISYGPLPSSAQLAVLVAEIGRDPYCCFFA